MEIDGRQESMYFIFWGLGVLGFGLLVIVAVDIIRFLLSKGTILWSREVIVLVIGTLCLLVSYRRLRKNY